MVSTMGGQCPPLKQEADEESHIVRGVDEGGCASRVVTRAHQTEDGGGQEQQQQMAPAPVVLRAVHGGEQEAGVEDGGGQAGGFLDQRLQETAEKCLLGGGAEGGGKDADQGRRERILEQPQQGIIHVA